MNVPWLALGTVYLLARARAARRVRRGLVVCFTGFAAGRDAQRARWRRSHGTAIPVGKDVFGALPRVLAAVGQRRRRGRDLRRRGRARRCASPRDPSVPGHGRLARRNGLIALGTLVLSSGGLVQGVVGHDEAFALSLAVGITVIYCGFVLAPADGRRSLASGEISRRVVDLLKPLRGPADPGSTSVPRGEARTDPVRGCGRRGHRFAGVREASQPAPSPPALAAGRQILRSLTAGRDYLGPLAAVRSLASGSACCAAGTASVGCCAS